MSAESEGSDSSAIIHLVWVLAGTPEKRAGERTEALLEHLIRQSSELSREQDLLTLDDLLSCYFYLQSHVTDKRVNEAESKSQTECPPEQVRSHTPVSQVCAISFTSGAPTLWTEGSREATVTFRKTTWKDGH